MKKAIILSAVLFSSFVSSFASSTGKSLVYNKDANATIGITVDNVFDGTRFTVKDKSGNIVKKGSLKNGQIVNLSTKNLKTGTYYFEIMGSIQEFVIQ